MKRNIVDYAIDAYQVDLRGMPIGWRSRIKVPERAQWVPVCNSRGKPELFGTKHEAMAQAGMVLVYMLNNARGIQIVVTRQKDGQSAVRSVSVSEA